MKKIIKAAGSMAVMSSLLCGAMYAVDHFLPAAYQVETRREAKVIYNKNGDVFVHSDPENMLRYLIREDSHQLRYALSNLESSLRGEK